ncbi:MAG: nitroreductase family protein [Oligoflexia bacterium]|nr:nitroreductase family protein [Oligoflexia bacterium]
MSFVDLALKRKSIRKYLNTPVEKDKILQCIEAARLAPSACNAQPWKFIVVDDPELREKAAGETFGKFISFNHFSLTAPVLVVVVTENANLSSIIGGMIRKKQFRLIDIGIAAEHFCMRAAELGLGTCMLGWFNEKALKKILKIPAGKNVDLVITVGYPHPDEDYPRPRKALTDIYSENEYY